MRQRLSFTSFLGLFAISALGAAACGDLKHADDSVDASTAASGADSGTLADAADGAFAAGKGPGPHGSLPSGYCCTADTECRYRHCVDTGAGGKMCLDECEHDAFCTRPDITFTCNTAASMCQPSPGFRCLPAASFTRGAKPLGACCNAGPAATNDGTAGSDCEGNQCAAVGNGPLVCTNRCSFTSDCAGAGSFTCILFGTSKACVPTSSSYTCN